MQINTKAYVEGFLKIRGKTTDIVPLRLNFAQRKMYNAAAKQFGEGKPIRVIILKARQMGFSTLTEAMLFKETATRANVSSGIVAHESAATDNLFRMSKRFYEYLPALIKPLLKGSNAKEIIFGHSDGASGIKCMTAGNENIGRSDTFQNLHISEYAFWPGRKKEILTGLLQAVPHERGTMVFIESTANGYDDFKDRWDAAVAGDSDFCPVFCAWHEHAAYRMEVPRGFSLTPEEKELAARFNLDAQQLCWRRWCLRNNCDNDPDLFKQEYPACPEEAFLMSGRPVFDTRIVAARIADLEQKYKNKPPLTGEFSFKWRDAGARDRILDDTIVFTPRQKGFIKIYKTPRPGRPYVIGGDTKGEGRDFYAGTVIDNSTGERVASLHMQVSESKPFTHQMYCLGKYYNNALIGIEANFNTAPIEELQRLYYPRQYFRQTYDVYTKKEQQKLGFKTDGNTRPIIIDKEIGLINEHIELFNDIDTLRECLTFVYDERNRPDAIAGKHDDLLFSDMIANEIRGQQRASVQAPAAVKEDFDGDAVEEYLRYGV